MMALNGNIFIRSLCFMVVYVGYTSLASLYGDTELAVSSIMMKLFMFFSFFVDGFAYAGEALVGKAFGELKIKNEELIKNDPLRAYSEEPHLGMWITGNKTAQSWVRKEEKTSFYQLHAYVNNIFTRLGVDIAKVTIERLENELFSDGLVLKAANGKALGFIGIVNRKLLKAFDLDQEVYYADLDWTTLLKQNKQYKAVITDLPKYPEVKRDFALLVDRSVEFADLARAAFATEKKLLKNVFLFDVYEGKNLEAGKKSYALSFILQDTENTLKDTQIEAVMNRLKKTFEEKFNATLR